MKKQIVYISLIISTICVSSIHTMEEEIPEKVASNEQVLREVQKMDHTKQLEH